MREVVLYFNDGAVLIEPFDDSDYREDLGEKKPSNGDWLRPFPTDSFAYGHMESEYQSDWSPVPNMCESHGDPVRLVLRDTALI